MSAYRPKPEGDFSELACPRCAVTMFIGRGSEMLLHGCGHCGGIFIDVEDSQRLQRAYPMAATELADRAAMASFDTPNLRAQVACPVCHETMQRTRLGGTTLELDVCSDGTWFDRDELRRAAETLHPAQPKSTVVLGVAEPEGGVYMQGLRALADLSVELLDQSNNPEVLRKRIERLERELRRG
jgi:Zn-finger nucleic acid-binding protein